MKTGLPVSARSSSLRYDASSAPSATTPPWGVLWTHPIAASCADASPSESSSARTTKASWSKRSCIYGADLVIGGIGGDPIGARPVT